VTTSYRIQRGFARTLEYVFCILVTVAVVVPLYIDVIGGFNESAGLHRAKGSDKFAWADSRAGGTGTVYVLSK